jgi:transcription elongation GreA/GreB family factor
MSAASPRSTSAPNSPSSRQFIPDVNKRALVLEAVKRLRADVALYARAARTARAEATDEQSKAENKYDTRGLEASYLARGQSRQLAETESAIEELEAFHPRRFGPEDVVDVGALVEVQHGRARDLFLLAPRAGGTEVEFDGREVTLLTPQSPLGSRLIGRRRGDVLDGDAEDARRKITAVS